MPCEHRSYSSHRSDRSHSSRFTPGALPALILLLAAGAALCAQPAARKPLPETAVLDRVDGRILHIDANDTWLFELTMEAKTPDYRLPAGTRFTLLPSATLGRLIADVNERYAPRYRLSARVTQYQGKNFLLPTYSLPLSKFKDDKHPEDRGLRAEDGDSNQKSKIKNQKSEEPDFAVPPEVLEQLKKQRPLRGPRRDSEVEKKPVQTPPERVLVDCVGRIEVGGNEDEGRIGDTGGIQEGEKVRKSEGRKGLSPSYFPTFLPSYVFVPYALGWNLSEIRYELLPCTALEQTLQKQTQVLDPIRFSVAGLVTEFKGKKYLLLQRAAVVYNYGNFGR
jgi:hypothetical protein